MKAEKITCDYCENGKDGACEEAELWITDKGVLACLTFRPLITVGNEESSKRS